MYEELNLDLNTTTSNENLKFSYASYNSVLNCLFLLTNDNKLILFDCNSRLSLKLVDWNHFQLEKFNFLRVHNIQEKCIVVSDKTVCSRLANDGLFLLDTVFQTSSNLAGGNLITSNNDSKQLRTLELNINDATTLLNALKIIESSLDSNNINNNNNNSIHNLNGLDTIIQQIEKQLSSLNLYDQWATVKITETYSNMLNCLTQCLEETKRNNLQSVAIPIFSLLLDRLYRLDSSLIETQIQNSMPITFTNFDKRYMCSEATRRATFNEWPHMDYKWVLPDALAQSGFYHQPTHPGDDRTICFVCDLCLVAWEQHDQPWSEHERHSPICQFVRGGEITENVPLALTAATQAAHQVFKPADISLNDRIVCTSELSSERYFAVSNLTGHIIVYDSKDILKEMMHVQLVNESAYNKHHQLKMHSLCFYYRNHKHVLYGSFTINDEVFIFSFNIFDIYRSYHSKSNKKSSKSHSKTVSNSVAGSSSSKNNKNINNNSISNNNLIPINTNNNVGTIIKNIDITPTINTNINNSNNQKIETIDFNITKVACSNLITNEIDATAKKTSNELETSQSQLVISPKLNNEKNNELITTNIKNSTTIAKPTIQQISTESSSSNNESTPVESSSNKQIVIEESNNDNENKILPNNSTNKTNSDTTETSNEKEETITINIDQTNIPKTTTDNKTQETSQTTPILNTLNTATTTTTTAINNNNTNKLELSTFSTPQLINNLINNNENNQNKIKNKNFIHNDLNMFCLPIQQQVANFQQQQKLTAVAATQSILNNSKQPINAANLSNHLTVRFEIGTNNQQQSETQSSSSKSKSKYKKSIKILSVSSKPLNCLDSNTDIQLKTFEFTEKCLSFRLASIDLASEPRKNYQVTLVNLYEKFLCALVNFTNKDNQKSFKLFRIKHEENSSSSSNTNSNSNSNSNSSNSLSDTNMIINTINNKLNNTNSASADNVTSTTTNSSSQSTPLANCLSATSSSRLNLTEFIFTSLASSATISSSNINLKVISIMPISVTTFEEDNDLKFIAILTDDGTISIIDPTKCCKILEFPSANSEDKFIQMTYCYGIDKICAITESNKIYMISTRVHPIINQSILDEVSGSLNLSSELSKTLLADSPINNANLNVLHNLIYFDTAKLNFSAKLPFCWTPILSEQHSQRKHPQHIHAESMNLTKSWRYMNNNGNGNNGSDQQTMFGPKMNKDDLNIELYLNKPAQIGCIQLRLKFNKEIDAPYELMLLTSRKYTESNTKSIGSTVDFNLNSLSKYDILYGPIDIRQFLDISNLKTYVITICSNKLYETRTNLFILNLKLKKNNNDANNQTSENNSEEKSNTINNNNNNIRILQKIQISIRKYRRTGIPNESIERNYMLVKISFLQNLLHYIFDDKFIKDIQHQIKLLDVLNWIFYNHLSFSDSNYLEQLKDAFNLYMDKFLLQFFIHGNRSTSKKATMFLNLILTKQQQNDDNESSQSFNKVLLDKLINNLRYLPLFESSASMNYYFTLIHQTMCSDMNKTYDTFIKMLTQLSNGHKYNPFYSLLKMRYNYSCLIFESKLFDIDLYFKFDSNNSQKQLLASSSSSQSNQLNQQQSQQPQIISNANNYTFSFGSVGLSVNNNNNNNSNNPANNNSSQQMIFNIKDYGLSSMNKDFNFNYSGGSTGLLSNGVGNSIPVGLLEVLPLNFKSISSSNGTSIDKNNSKQETSLYVLPDYFGSNKQQQNESQPTQIDTSIFSSIFNLNPLQYLIVERMEPVSRHFVVLDFGYPVALTDIMIPACTELSSISIDIWLHKEQKDSKRLCVSTDINNSPILLNDLQPVAVCRYVKIIYVAYSANIVKAKIPIGFFFGYPFIFSNESITDSVPQQNNTTNNNNSKQLVNYLNYLEKLYEDNQCHYSMSIGKLRDLLNEINFPSDNIGHLKMMQFNHNEANNDLSNKIKDVYNECLDFQFQLNLNAQLIKRLKMTIDVELNEHLEKQPIENLNFDLDKMVELMSQDQLRVTNSLLIKTLLCLTCDKSNNIKLQSELIENSQIFSCGKLSLNMAFELFCNLCVYGNLEKECSLLLLRCCYNESWWGDFISKCLRRFFVLQIKEVMPLSKIFITLNDICFKSLAGTQTDSLFRSLFSLIEEILKPLDKNVDECVEVTSLEWILLFVSRLISVIDKTRDSNNRWEFLENVYTTQKQSSQLKSSSNRSTSKSSKIKKKLFQSNKYFNWSKLKENRKNLDRYRKHLWKANDNYLNNINLNTNDNESKLNLNKRIYLPRDISLSVGKLLTKLLISANSYCSSDLFVLSCRIISSISCNTTPSISLNEIINKTDLNQLILLNVSNEFNHGSVCWGSPWSQHALISLFMDIIENEKLNSERFQTIPHSTNVQTANANSKSTLNTIENNLKIIEELDEISSSSAENSSINLTNSLQKPQPTNISDAVKLTGNLANNFKQIAEMLSSHLNKMNTMVENSMDNVTIDDKNNKNVEATKKIDEIKINFNAAPLQQLNFLANSSSSTGQSTTNTILPPGFNNYLSTLNKKFEATFQKHQSASQFNSNNHHQKYSTNLININRFKSSYDIRLDTSFYQTLENALFIKQSLQTEAINNSFTEPLSQLFIPKLQTQDDTTPCDSKLPPKQFTNTNNSVQLLQETIEILFEDLTKINIENLLSFWLTLSQSDNQEPNFYLNETTINYLIETLLNYPFMTVKLWYLSFKTLSSLLLSSSKRFTNDSNQSIAFSFATNNSLYKFIYKFLSSNHDLVGDECCSSMLEFLKKLSESIQDTPGDYEYENRKRLFEVLCMSIDNDGCMSRYQGPIDGQVTFVEYLMSEDLLKCYDFKSDDDYDDENNDEKIIDSSFEQMIVKYFNSLSKLVQHHLCIYPRLSHKGETSPRSCFSGILTSLLFGPRSTNNTNFGSNDKFKSSFETASGQSIFANQNPFSNNQNSNNTNNNNNNNINHNSNHIEKSSSSTSSSFKPTNSIQSVLCNRDILTCLLLKYAINIISDNVKTLPSSYDLFNFDKMNQPQASDISDQQQQQLTVPAGTSSSLSKNDNIYEDDFLVQQLFLFELQQMEENEAQNIHNSNGVCDSNHDIDLEPDFECLINNNNNSNAKLNAKKMKSKQKYLNGEKQRNIIKSLSNECLENFIESLALCQSSALAMVISNSGYPIELSLDDIQTSGDGLFVLLKSIIKEPLKLVDPLFNYLNKIKRLSEPLLWFFSSLFANEIVVRAFIEKGGINVIEKGLNITTRQLLYSGPCIVSSLMNYIDTERQQMKAINNLENDSNEGFTNFAPFGSIICTNPSGNPADVLVQNAAPHRRIRSAIWSYHFQPDEHKVGLFLTFPYAFLLKEVQILPHTVSFGNCPAYVSVEVSRDGSFMSPIGAPIFTMGMSAIKLQLNKSELVNTVQINLYKSKDSQMIGLSQIRLLGYPMFENMLSAKPDMMLTPVEDLVSRSNMGWLRLLYISLTSIPNLESYVCEKINDNTMLLCTRLLSSPAMIIYDKIIETILIKLSKHNTKRSLEITKYLLRVENGFKSGLFSVPHGILMETLINILYQISENSTTDDDGLIEKERIDLILNWLAECLKAKDLPSKIENSSSTFHQYPSNMILHCAACILYKSKQTTLIESSFLQSVIDFSTNINEYYTRQAINWIICSLLYKNPDLIKDLTNNIDLNKESENTILLIETLSYAIQSTQVVNLFLRSEFFTKFIEFFMKKLSNSRKMDPNKPIDSNYIKVFLALAEYEEGQAWLGSENGCSMWQELVDLLCNSYRQINNSEEICILTIHLIKKMLFLNIDNQTKFALYITKLIKRSSLNNDIKSSSSSPTISSFLHQIILQILLEDQKLTVNFQRKAPIFKTSCNSSLGLLTHPKFGTGNNYRTIDLPLTKTLGQIISLISDIPFSPASILPQPNQTNESFDILNKFNTTANNNSSNNIKQDESSNKVSSLNLTIPKIKLFLKNEEDLTDNKEIKLSNDITLNKALCIYLKKSKKRIVHNLNMVVQLSYDSITNETAIDLGDIQDLEDISSSPLDAFVKCDGLIVLAECLPILMPFIHEPLLNVTDKDRLLSSQSQDQPSKTSPDFVDYVIMTNESDEPFVDDYNEMPISSNTNTSNKLKKITMPPHAFIAFGLFLKIPGYASVMLRNRRQAQCILKLLLGSNRSKEEEFGLSLSTMPFTSLKDLLNDTRISSDLDIKLNLTQFIYENGILTLILTILSSLSHHPHRQKHPHFSSQLVPESSLIGTSSVNDQQNVLINTEEKNNLYWAKGTGFGTGSTMQQWDAEKTLMQQKMEEEHVTCIFEILSSYITCCQPSFSSVVLELFDHSCVISALSSYLRNDSVLDMSRHVPLYKSALKLLQAFILSDNLKILIEQCNIFDLIKNMKLFVDSYTQRIKLNEEGGLSCLVPVLNTTYELVVNHIKPAVEKNNQDDGYGDETLDLEKVYCEMVKSLQFDTYPIIIDNNNGTFKANISYYYESCLNETANLNNANRAKRLAQETVTLSNSLPVSFSSSVFVRCDEDRLDVMKVLITGPQDTPYENGCFEFDVFFPSDYPDSPPMINLQTTGNQTHRFNPNLYHDGKVCLSILNTWHGRPEERWNGQTSSFLQVLVSIQSLILVADPYFNEPGYERSRGTPAGTASSIEYDANIRQATVKWAMLEMIKKTPPCFKDVVRKHFYYKRKQIREQCETWLKEIEMHINDKQIGQSILKSSVALKRHMTLLFEELDKIKEEIEAEENQQNDNEELESENEVTEANNVEK